MQLEGVHLLSVHGRRYLCATEVSVENTTLRGRHATPGPSSDCPALFSKVYVQTRRRGECSQTNDPASSSLILATQLGFEELKRKAQSDISGKLTHENILDELFSTLPCRYVDGSTSLDGEPFSRLVDMTLSEISRSDMRAIAPGMSWSTNFRATLPPWVQKT